MGLSISAEEKRIIELFAKTNKYIIPSYQRPYSWGEKECSELWDDLNFRFEDRNSDGYFLGNIVLAKSKSNLDIEVIDGQQRLLTLIIILKVLYLIKFNRDLEESIWHIDRDTEDKFPRVKTLVYEDKDNKNFENILKFKIEDIDKIEIKKANQFEENMLFFYDKLKEFTDKKIISFRNFVLDKLYVLSIQSIDLEEDKAREKALVIFETINNRGLDLSDADIFKAQLYNSALNQKKSQDFIEKWKDLVELAKVNKYANLVDVFRIYTHILRGKKRETGNEIGLRKFFMQDGTENNDKIDYKPLRKRDYNEVIKDLNKILLTVDTFNNSIQNKNSKYSKFSKWFQVIEEYTNNYPKYIIFIYLYYNTTILEDNTLLLDSKKEDELLLLSQNIIRYVYMHSSAMKIKFEIFKLIAKIAHHETYSFIDTLEKVNEENFRNFGKKDGRRKGFSLLSIYLDTQQDTVYSYYFDKLINSINKKNLNSSWDNQDYDDYYYSIANQLVTDNKTKTKALDRRVKSFEESKILDLNRLSKKLKNNNLNYKDFKDRENENIKRLVSFFSKDTLW